MIDLKKEIRAYALKNAMEFGKTNPGTIIPKLFQHGLDKKDLKEVMGDVVSIVNEVNKMKEDERMRAFEEVKGLVKERVEEEKGLAELPNVSNKMVFRLAPFPSGALHLGNAKTYLLNALYAEKYKATTLLVMDDTIGSEEKSIMPESYKLMEGAFKWLGVKYDDKIIYKSDRLKIYYEYAEKLIEKDKAYVCHCPQDKLRENRARGLSCGCREFPIKMQLLRWKEMFKAEQGDAILRIKTNMLDPNPAFRDRVLFKISDKEHPRVGKKYRVWPTLDMCWAIDDHLLGITHILRGNDLMIETDMEKYIWDIFGWEHPVTIHTGLIRIEGIEGAKLSKSKAQAEVKSGEFSGWDDPRTWSMQSLKRRGIKAESVRAFVEGIGLNKQDITVPIDTLYSINRKLIDEKASRYSFVEDPVGFVIEDAPDVHTIQVPVHPDSQKTREIKVDGEVYVSRKDYEANKSVEFRLLHLYNILISSNGKARFVSMENKPIQKIQWVSNPVDTRILMPDGKWIEGMAESSIKELKKGEMIQFERFGFVRFDGVNKGMYEFWFAHR